MRWGEDKCRRGIPCELAKWDRVWVEWVVSEAGDLGKLISKCKPSQPGKASPDSEDFVTDVILDFSSSTFVLSAILRITEVSFTLVMMP